MNIGKLRLPIRIYLIISATRSGNLIYMAIFIPTENNQDPRHDLRNQALHEDGGVRTIQRPLHLVSPWAQCKRMVLGQVKVEEKSSGIISVSELLRQLEINSYNRLCGRVEHTKGDRRRLHVTCYLMRESDRACNKNKTSDGGL